MSEPTRTEAWSAFLEGATYARASPRFDHEERDRKLETASHVRQLLETARERGSVDVQVARLLVELRDPGWPYRLTLPAHAPWLERWADSDEASLARALAGFLDSDKAPEVRFDAFAEAAERAEARGATEPNPRALLAFGSLFNFCLEPRTLPVVRSQPFRHLEELLGRQPEETDGPVGREYRNHLQFASWLENELRDLRIRDMLDLQALIFLSDRKDFWTLDSLPADSAPEADAPGWPARPLRPGQAYFAVASCLGYDAPYLEEWIEFHRLMGAERFFLYNNGDRQAQRDLLAPYVDRGIVVLHDWPNFPPQETAYTHCVREHAEDARWIACIDTDEFLFSPTGDSLPEVLAGYEHWPGVGVNPAHFLTSGHREKPAGLVTENYTTVTRHDRTVKMIVDPARAVRWATPHRFIYVSGFPVDENEHPIREEQTTYTSFSRLRINHYHTRSEAEFRTKSARPRPDTGAPYAEPDFDEIRRLESMFGRRDEAILGHVPALREALEKRETTRL
jgi:hypothetical protein